PTPPGPPSGPLLPDLPSSPMQPGAAGIGDFTPPNKLPVTGTDALPLALLGIAAVAAGSAAVAATRRRTVRES
ncbi:LPXTG cell wall anchor domain-containing protein, partial [Actinomadura soli]